jgi:hypothetical protein
MYAVAGARASERGAERVIDKTMTVAQYADIYLARGRGLFNGQPWAKNTVLKVRASMRNHIVPDIGHWKMNGRVYADGMGWVQQMQDAGIGPAAQTAALEVAGTMFKAWSRERGYDGSPNPIPAQSVTKKQETQEEAEARKWAPPPESMDRWIEAMGEKKPELAIVMEMECFYGGRMSEIIGLTEASVIWTGKDITAPLAPQLAKLVKLPAGRYEALKPGVKFQGKVDVDRQIDKRMKNRRAHRTRPLPQYLAVKLARQLAVWPPNDDGVLFVGREPARGRHAWQGLSLRPYPPTYYCRLVRQAAERAGIELPPYKATHTMRNYCAHQLRAKGWSDDEIGRWIGDASGTVAAYYGQEDENIINGMAADMVADRTRTEKGLRVVRSQPQR